MWLMFHYQHCHLSSKPLLWFIIYFFFLWSDSWYGECIQAAKHFKNLPRTAFHSSSIVSPFIILNLNHFISFLTNRIVFEFCFQLSDFDVEWEINCKLSKFFREQSYFFRSGTSLYFIDFNGICSFS